MSVKTCMCALVLKLMYIYSSHENQELIMISSLRSSAWGAALMLIRKSKYHNYDRGVVLILNAVKKQL